MNHPDKNAALSRVPVWDRTTRWFHWLNVLCVLGLAGIGIVILNASALGVSDEGKIDLKTVHAWVGYVFALNLLWRIVWGFIGGRYARWRSVLPFGKGYAAALKAYTAGWRDDDPPRYRGHNPLARLMLLALFGLLAAQMVTGLVLAGTDLYLPPFGHEIAEWVTGAGEDHSRLAGLEPGGSSELLDQEAYAAMREFRSPFITVHKWSFYALLVAMFLHVYGVVVTELRERNGIVSAMFTGEKVFDREPED